MSISFSTEDDNGLPIAFKLSPTSNDSEIVYLNKHKDENPNKIKISDFFVNLLRKQNSAGQLFRQYLNLKDVNMLKECFDFNYPPKNQKLVQIYNKVIELYNNSTGSSLRCFEGERLIPLFEPVDGKIKQVVITGPSGIGKTRLAGLIIRKHIEEFPTSRIYIFTSLDSDPSLDNILPEHMVERILLDEQLLEFDSARIEPDSIVLFDDVETINGSGYDPKTAKNIIKKMEQIRDEAITTFRHNGVKLIINIIHDLMSYKSTKKLNLESQYLIWFNNAGNRPQIKRLLMAHWGLDESQIKQAFDLPNSTWVLYSRIYPQYFMWKEGICSV